MKKFSPANWWYLAFTVLLFFVEFTGSRNALHTDYTDEYSGKVISTIEKKQQDFEKIWENDTLIRHIRNGAFREDVLSELRSRKLMALVFEQQQMVYWSSVAIDQGIGRYADSSGYGMADISRGWYFYESRKMGKQVVMLAYPLYRRYQVTNNPLLDEGFNVDLGLQTKAEWSQSPVADYVELRSEILPYSVYVKFDDTKGNAGHPLFLVVFLLGLVCLVLFLFQVFDYTERRYSYFRAWLLVSGLIVLIRAASFFFKFPYSLYATGFFSGKVFSQGILLLSLGDLFADTLLFFIIVFTLFKGYLLAQRENRLQYKLLLFRSRIIYLSVPAALIFTLLTLGIIQALIGDPQLDFEVTNILHSGTNTLVCLFISAMLLTAHYLVVNMLTGVFKYTGLSFFRLLPALLISLAALAPAVYIGAFSFVLLIQSLTYLVAIFITFHLFESQSYFRRTLGVIFIVSVFASSLFYRAIHDREKEKRAEIAENIFSPKDLNAESIFLEIEANIELDRYIREYFRNPLILKSQLEKRIKQLYFTGYLSRYDIDIFDYDLEGNSFKELNYYTYSYLSAVYDNKTQSTLSNHFYYINDPALRFGYMAKYEVCTEQHTLGVLFIMLKPKFVQDEKIFTELLSRPPDQQQQDLSNYSYAIYQDNSLISQSGPFPYPLMQNFGGFQATGFLNSEGYSHFLKKEEGNIVILVSKKQDSLMEPVTIFSFLFLSFCFFAALVFLLNLSFVYLRLALARFGGKRRRVAGLYGWITRLLSSTKFRGIYFSTRIQLASISLVLVALLLTGYFTIQYIGFKYSQRQHERLDSKVKSILSAIENEKRFEEMMLYNDELAAYLNQLAEFYNTDINLYDLEGRLKASTQMRIFQSGMLLNKINPLAFSKIYEEKRSQHIQAERIGMLEYQAAYVPVFDSRHELLCYLNVPFFSNEKELSRERSDFLENFINIYVFFFIVAGVLAFFISKRITLPLTLIQSKLADIRLGGKNERLEWRQNDEIGQLVRQYNFMVDQLERSAAVLAKSEREDAWKEMAKQIAHEIKNPLTPMKLSVQHLQRAWAGRSENLEQTFKRVTGVLIEQIESLSLLATEFSSFAKMPAAKPENFELTEVIDSIVELYFNSEGITISYRAATERLPVRADKNQLSRVFNNVIKNAVQAIPSGMPGLIQVSLEKEDACALVKVQDNGIGISPEIAKSIFSPSFSTKNSGMGLGLAISRQIIENIGGSISFESEEGTGASFYVRVPLDAADAE
jgi:two-component system nitrogen regulation sensor histidine kinase NtrY